MFSTKMAGPNVRTFNSSVDNCYLAAKRAVLSQNFRIEKEDLQAKSFTAARYFEDGKDSIVLTANANVIAFQARIRLPFMLVQFSMLKKSEQKPTEPFSD